MFLKILFYFSPLINRLNYEGVFCHSCDCGVGDRLGVYQRERGCSVFCKVWLLVIAMSVFCLLPFLGCFLSDTCKERCDYRKN